MTLFARRNTPFPVYEIQILKADDKQLQMISQELKIGLNLEEIRTVKKYFKEIGRNPITERGKIHSLLQTYIARATIELDLPWCISVFEDNAGIVEFEGNFAIGAKVETHNHPSAIEPFGGAATGVGGVIRDVLGVWADPIACTDVLGFGPLSYEYNKLPPGIKHPRYVFNGVVAGIGCYGNNMGIPTVNGAIFFDESWAASHRQIHEKREARPRDSPCWGQNWTRRNSWSDLCKR